MIVAQAFSNALKANNLYVIGRLEKDYLPSGSGVDRGTTFRAKFSSENRLSFCMSYHHMDQHGGYTGWLEYNIIVDATFSGIRVRIGGKDMDDLKEYLQDLMHACMVRELSTKEWMDLNAS